MIDPALTSEELSKVTIYVTGLIHCSVCVPYYYTPEQVVRAVNFKSPTGVMPWQISEEDFSGGESNPYPCNKCPEDRTHWLMDC